MLNNGWVGNDSENEHARNNAIDGQHAVMASQQDDSPQSTTSNNGRDLGETEPSAKRLRGTECPQPVHRLPPGPATGSPIIQAHLSMVFPKHMVDSIVSVQQSASISFTFANDLYVDDTIMDICIKPQRVQPLAKALYEIELETAQGKRRIFHLENAVGQRIDGSITLENAGRDATAKWLGESVYTTAICSYKALKEDTSTLSSTYSVEMKIPGDPKSPATLRIFGHGLNLAKVAMLLMGSLEKSASMTATA